VLSRRTEKSETQKKMRRDFATKRQNPRDFSSLLLLLSDDDLVRLDSPWAIRPYANQ